MPTSPDFARHRHASSAVSGKPHGAVGLFPRKISPVTPERSVSSVICSEVEGRGLEPQHIREAAGEPRIDSAP